jgi:hypothetical protein
MTTVKKQFCIINLIVNQHFLVTDECKMFKSIPFITEITIIISLKYLPIMVEIIIFEAQLSTGIGIDRICDQLYSQAIYHFLCSKQLFFQ